MRRVLLVALIGAIGPTLLSTWAAAQTDRGEPPRAIDLLALGEDVKEAVGAPDGQVVAGTMLENKTNELTARMRCPVCQGHAIEDSPSETARNMKRQVRAMIAAGYSEQQIMGYFEASYGEFIRLMPRPEGFNLTVWILPISALAIGGLWLIWALKRKPSAPVASSVDSAASSSEWLSRVRDEVDGPSAEGKG